MSIVVPSFNPNAGNADIMVAEFDVKLSIGSDGYIVDATSHVPFGVTVSQPAVPNGSITVTMSCKYSLLSPVAVVAADTPVALFAQVASEDSDSFVVNTVNGSGALTTPSAACRLHIHIKAKL